MKREWGTDKNIWRFIMALKDLEFDQSIRYQQLEAGRLKEPQRKSKDINSDLFILKEKNKYLKQIGSCRDSKAKIRRTYKLMTSLANRAPEFAKFD